MANLPFPTIHSLRQRLKYDQRTGKLYWTSNNKEAFTYKGKRGYKVSTYTDETTRRTLLAHRVAWAIFYGHEPIGQIDHINGDKTDNRITNLRCVTNQENSKNTKVRKTNKSGVTGVYRHSKCDLWVAQITVDGKTHHIGSYNCIDEAKKARKQAEETFGFHKNHGR